MMYEVSTDPKFLVHHGILGQKKGIRRFQNEDGSLTPAGRERYLKGKRDSWQKENGTITRTGKRKLEKIKKQAEKDSRREISKYERTEMRGLQKYNKDGSLSRNYANQYNRKLAEIMNTKVSDIRSPSGKVVRFVASRQGIGVYAALADAGYDIGKLRSGVYSDGRIAYKKNKVVVSY